MTILRKLNTMRQGTTKLLHTYGKAVYLVLEASHPSSVLFNLSVVFNTVKEEFQPDSM